MLDGGLTNGEYQLQIRLQQRDEKPGSTVRHADIRYAQIGIDVRGLPAHSPLLSETDEVTGDHNGPGGAQNLGNLLETDLNTVSVAGELGTSSDIDFYQFNTDEHFGLWEETPFGDQVRGQALHFLKTHYETGVAEVIAP